MNTDTGQMMSLQKLSDEFRKTADKGVEELQKKIVMVPKRLEGKLLGMSREERRKYWKEHRDEFPSWTEWNDSLKD